MDAVDDIERQQLAADWIGPEVQALRATARGLILVAAPFALLLVGSPYLVAGLNSTLEVLLGALCLVLLVAGLAYSRRRFGLWLLVASMCAAVAWQLAFPDGTSEYSSIDVIIVFFGISALMLVSRWVGAGIVVLVSVLVWWIWTHGPADAVRAAPEIGEGLASQSQVAFAVLFAWWAWNVLRTEAIEHDATFAQIVIGTRAAVDLRARARARQEVSTVIHESLLNTIRYVLHSPALSVELLRDEVDRTDSTVLGLDAPASLAVSSLALAIADDAPSRSLVHVRVPEDDLTMDRDVFAALRGAVSEAVRNAHRHGGASRVDIVIDVPAQKVLSIEISDDGSGMDATAVEGFGLRHAIVSSVQAIGGHVNIAQQGSSVRITIDAPIDALSEPVLPRLDAFDKSRFIVTSALSGLAVGGLFFVFALVTEFAPAEWLATAVATLGFVLTPVIVFRRKALRPMIGLFASLVVASIPWLLLADQVNCAESPTIIGIIGASGAAVTTIALWVRRGAAVVGVVAWAAGAWLLLTHVPSDCRVVTLEASTYIVSAAPILLLAGFFIMRQYERAQVASARAVEERRHERTHAEAAQLIDAEYGSLVQEAQQVLADVVSQGELSDEQRARLIQVEAKIRAVIQVDPETAGGMAVFARDVVNRFANRGLRVHTKSFVDSHDQRPVSESDRAVLRELLAPVQRGDLEVQLITDGVRDLLTMKFSGIDADIPDQILALPDMAVHVTHLELADTEVDLTVVVVREIVNS